MPIRRFTSLKATLMVGLMLGGPFSSYASLESSRLASMTITQATGVTNLMEDLGLNDVLSLLSDPNRVIEQDDYIKTLTDDELLKLELSKRTHIVEVLLSYFNTRVRSFSRGEKLLRELFQLSPAALTPSAGFSPQQNTLPSTVSGAFTSPANMPSVSMSMNSGYNPNANYSSFGRANMMSSSINSAYASNESYPSLGQEHMMSSSVSSQYNPNGNYSSLGQSNMAPPLMNAGYAANASYSSSGQGNIMSPPMNAGYAANGSYASSGQGNMMPPLMNAGYGANASYASSGQGNMMPPSINSSYIANEGYEAARGQEAPYNFATNDSTVWSAAPPYQDSMNTMPGYNYDPFGAQNNVYAPTSMGSNPTSPISDQGSLTQEMNVNYGDAPAYDASNADYGAMGEEVGVTPVLPLSDDNSDFDAQASNMDYGGDVYQADPSTALTAVTVPSAPILPTATVSQAPAILAAGVTPTAITNLVLQYWNDTVALTSAVQQTLQSGVGHMDFVKTFLDPQYAVVAGKLSSVAITLEAGANSSVVASISRGQIIVPLQVSPAELNPFFPQLQAQYPQQLKRLKALSALLNTQSFAMGG